MGNQVGSGEVAIVPTFKGFRRAVTSEVDGSAKDATSGFSRAFGRSGQDAGKETGQGFKKAFEQSSNGFSGKATKALEADVAKASRALSAARLKEQDAAGKARVAEAQLNEARQKYADDSSQVIRAQERQESALRQLRAAQERTEGSTDDLKRAQQELARAADNASDELVESGRRGGSGFKTSFVGGMKGIGLAIAGVIAAAGITGMVTDVVGSAVRSGFEFVQESVVQASDLNESLNAVQVAFGDVNSEIVKLGENSAKRLGLSKSEFNGFAVQFSSFASTIRSSDVAGFIDELTTRGADFASVYNIEVGEALSLFQSGLAGETEPLRRFGIDLSAAAVEAYAYSSGIAAAGTELSETQKQQARYGLLLQQTAKTQGDFQNTSGELANQQRIFQASLADTQAALGSYLLPGLTQIMQIANDTLLPVLSDVIEKVGPQLGTALAEAAPKFGELLTQLAPMIPELVKLGTEALPPLLELIIAIAPALTDWATNQAAIVEGANLLFGLLSGDTSVSEAMERFGQMGGSLVELSRGIGSFTADAVGNFVKFSTGVGQSITGAVNWVASLPGRALSVLGDLGNLLYDSGRSLIEGFIGGIRDMIGAAGDAVAGVLDYVAGFFPHSPAKRGPFSGAGWRAVREGGQALSEQFYAGFSGPTGVDLFGSGGLVRAASVPSAAAASAGAASFPRSLVLRVGDREFVAYLEEVADGRVALDGRSRSTVKTLGRRPTG